MHNIGSGAGSSSHAPHTPVAAAVPRRPKKVRTPAELQALAQARALLPGGNTVDVLEQLPASILELLEPTNIYTCELAAQYIFVVYGRTRVLAQASTKPEPGSREEEFNNYVKRVHSELHRLFFHATAADGQPLCCEGERLLATKAAQEGWSGASFIKMLAEVRVTVLLWSREKLARFLDAIFNFAQLQAKGESLDWSALPITCTCFGTFTASKSVSRVWKWGACSSALVVGLIACGYEDLVGEPMNDLRQHVETVFAFSANNMACAQLKVLFGIFSKARKAWSNLLKGELLARATVSMGAMAIEAPANQQHNHAQQLVMANSAAAGNQEQRIVDILAEMNSKQRAVDSARALQVAAAASAAAAAAALPLDVMDSPGVEEALYGTTEVAHTLDAEGKKDLENHFPAALKESLGMEVKLVGGHLEGDCEQQL